MVCELYLQKKKKSILKTNRKELPQNLFAVEQTWSILE